MTPTEFKSWFDGFTEAMSGTPTKAQWARIQARVAEIDGKTTTHTVYVNRYLNDYFYHYPRPYWGAMGIGASQAGGAISTSMADYRSAINNSADCQNGGGFNSSAAMTALGRADAMALAA